MKFKFYSYFYFGISLMPNVPKRSPAHSPEHFMLVPFALSNFSSTQSLCKNQFQIYFKVKLQWAHLQMFLPMKLSHKLSHLNIATARRFDLSFQAFFKYLNLLDVPYYFNISCVNSQATRKIVICKNLIQEILLSQVCRHFIVTRLLFKVKN